MASTAETPRAVPSVEAALKGLNRGTLSAVPSTFSQDADFSDVGSSRATPRMLSGARTAREPRERQATSKEEFEARRRKKEHTAKHEALLRQREADEQKMQERRLKGVQMRESRFEARMQELTSGDSARVEASDIIREHEEKYERKRLELYDAFDENISRRVEAQLSRFMAPKAFDETNIRSELRPQDHPGLRDLRDQQAEERFHRYANVILQPTPRGNMQEDLRMRRAAAELEASRNRSRPTLPVEQWAQHEHYASVNGYFAQSCEAGGTFHSQRRMGANAHIIDESDGVIAHGKNKNRFQKNLLGLLEGNAAKEGESARHKRDHGAGSGAPCQDHFYYEQGIPISDAEFPVGKKMFPHLRA